MRSARLILPALLLMVTLSAPAQNITFVPQWTPQSQFAGFYVAYEKGFFAEEGLDVTILHPGLHSSESAFDMLESGRAQIAGMQTLQTIVSRSKGKKLVNIMQVTQKTGLCCVSHSPINSISDLAGKRLGRWKMGFHEICDILAARENVDVRWISFINGINLFVYGAVDATLCFSYSELIRLELAVGDIAEENILRFSEQGYDIPEDGLVVTEEYWRDHQDDIDKFVRASRRGWSWARENKEEALRISRKYVDEAHVITNNVLERQMLDAYLDLQVNPRSGVADFSPMPKDVFDNIVDDMYSTGLIDRKVEYNELIRQ